jgi:hypothetical protein
MLVGACLVWLAYRSQPARFHARLTARGAARAVVPLVLLVSVFTLLAATHAL